MMSLMASIKDNRAVAFLARTHWPLLLVTVALMPAVGFPRQFMLMTRDMNTTRTKAGE